jgi:hypothetical protein
MNVNSDLVTRYSQLFCNRLAYTLQSFKPDEDSGRHHFFLATWQATSEPLNLMPETLRRHLLGNITVGFFAHNPLTQRCKWVAVDADYENALKDLRTLQAFLLETGIDSALELSRRGGHLWVFMEPPALARDCRIYFLNLALELGIPIKGPNPKKDDATVIETVSDGVEVFPKQDEIGPGGFGNAVRGPLGIHRAVGKRFWFEGAKPDLAHQMAYLLGLNKLAEGHLKRLIQGKTLPQQFDRKALPTVGARQDWAVAGSAFRILDHVVARKKGKEYVAQCPSCAQAGGDRRGRDNLHISVANPLMYICRAGCTTAMIRQALGRPKRLSA